MIRVVDYGVGNIQAFLNMFKRLDLPAERARTPQDLMDAKHLILPGVWAEGLRRAHPLGFPGRRLGAGAARLATINTALWWTTDPQLSGKWVALEKGWLAEAGLKVTWRPGGPNTRAGTQC